MNNNEQQLMGLVNIFSEACYYALENDQKYKNMHFIKRKLFLNKYRHDEEYVKKVEEYTKRDKKDLHKECVECIFFIRGIIKRELENTAKLDKDKIPTDLEEKLFEIINMELNKKYDGIKF